MIDLFEIFKRLKEYKQDPPDEVRQRIFDNLETDFKKTDDSIVPDKFEQLQELEIYPPSSVYTTIEQRMITAFQLSFLKKYQVAPPEGAYNSILKKIEREDRLSKLSSGSVVKIISRYRAAIAIILITGIGWFSYQLAIAPSKPVTETATNYARPAEIKPDSTQFNTNLTNDKKSIAEVPSKKMNTTIVKKTVQQKKIMVTADGYKFPLVNDDLLASFTSFEYRHLPPFVTNKEQKGFMVRTDQYTAISVSESMNRMIRRMNLYRRNGKLKVRAKKTRERLEKWKKADAKQFDKSLINNPLDPLDLAEFIFN